MDPFRMVRLGNRPMMSDRTASVDMLSFVSAGAGRCGGTFGGKGFGVDPEGC